MPNFGHYKFLPVFLPIFGHSKFLPVFLYQTGLNKFRMHIFGHSEFIPVFWGKIVGKKLEWPFGQKKFLFWNFPKFQSLDIFWRSCVKQCFLHLVDIWSIGHLCPMQHLARHNNNCDVTVATLPNELQLCPCWTAWDIVPYKQCLHVPYKSELIITQMSIQTSIIETPYLVWIFTYTPAIWWSLF